MNDNERLENINPKWNGMNLSKLFELQRQLDEHIEREHPPKEGEDSVSKENPCADGGIRGVGE